MEYISKSELQYFYSMQDQLKEHLYRREKECFDRARAERDAITNVDGLKAYTKAIRERFIENIGGIINDGSGLDARITAERDYEDYRLQNIIFRSRRNVYVTGSMYIPHGIKEPSAAILFLHGHSDDTRHYIPYQIACDTFARAGFIVFAVDPMGQGERVSYYNDQKGDYDILPCTRDHDAAGIPATATDRFLASYFMSDEVRALDYMMTRPEIDKNRIGVTGNSGGGTQTMIMMAVDDRIAAAAPATFCSSREVYMHTGQPQDAEQIWFGATPMGFDHITPIMMIAPKPCAILSVNYDFYAIEGTGETVSEARRFYEMYGKPENLEWIRDDARHEYTPKLSAAAAKFFAKHLLGKDIEISNDDYVEKPFRDFYATRSGRVRGEIKDARFMFDENCDRARQLFEERHSVPDCERLKKAKKWLFDAVTGNRKPTEFYIRRLGETSDGKFVTEGIFWHSQEDVFNFGLMIRSEAFKEKKLPVIIALWKNGVDAIKDHEDFIRTKSEEGFEVLVLDVTGTGYIEQAYINAYGKTEMYATNYKLCCDFLFMRDSVAALRTWDVLRAVEMLESEYGVAQENVTLYCESKYGVYGVVAAFLNRKVNVIYGEGLIKSVEKEFVNAFIPEYDDDYAFIFPKMLEYFDYCEIMR